jgi:multimeric flavodoxin WrbA
MKYLIINGSPRKKNTWSAVKQAKANLDGEFEEIHLMKEKIPMCNGCFKCILEGEERCPHFYMIDPIIEKIRQCDAIIVASPVYAMNVTALLKNFLDHTAYLYHRPEFFTKKALVVVTTAGAGHKDVSNYIDETLRHWGVNKVYKIAIACGGKDTLETSQIDKTAKKFGDDVKSGKLHSPKFKDIIFFNVWKAMAVSEDPMKADEKYWKSTGLVNHDFSPEVKLNVIKKLFSKAMFLILKRVM